VRFLVRAVCSAKFQGKRMAFSGYRSFLRLPGALSGVGGIFGLHKGRRYRTDRDTGVTRGAGIHNQEQPAIGRVEQRKVFRVAGNCLSLSPFLRCLPFAPPAL
jgi:hypothetical protein